MDSHSFIRGTVYFHFIERDTNFHSLVFVTTSVHSVNVHFCILLVGWSIRVLVSQFPPFAKDLVFCILLLAELSCGGWG